MMNGMDPSMGGVLPDNDVVLAATSSGMRSWPDFSDRSQQSPLENGSLKQKRQRSANWSLQEEVTLIAVYRELEKRFETKKQLWDQLSAILSERGFDRKPVSLEQKWGNMLQTYRAIKDHDRTRPPGAPEFFGQNVPERKALLYGWKVNSLEEKSFESMDEFLRDRGHTLQPHYVFNAVANTLLLKMADTERLFAKTTAADVEKCKQYMSLLKEATSMYKELKSAAIAYNPTATTAPVGQTTANSSHAMLQQQQQQQQQAQQQQQQVQAAQAAHQQLAHQQVMQVAHQQQVHQQAALQASHLQQAHQQQVMQQPQQQQQQQPQAHAQTQLQHVQHQVHAQVHQQAQVQQQQAQVQQVHAQAQQAHVQAAHVQQAQQQQLHQSQQVMAGQPPHPMQAQHHV